MLGKPVTQKEKPEKKNWKLICKEKLNFDPDKCPCSKKGRMVTKEFIEKPKRGPLAISNWDNLQVTH